MRWSCTEQGYYWYFSAPGDDVGHFPSFHSLTPQVFYVTGRRTDLGGTDWEFAVADRMVRVSEARGAWLGPIVPPADPRTA